VASTDAGGRDLWEDRAMRRTVLIVDDHEAFRESAAALLEAEGFDVVGEAADGHQAVAAVERLQPEVVLLDIRLPDLDGFAVPLTPASPCQRRRLGDVGSCSP
jgi:PleD family two-component response regulator